MVAAAGFSVERVGLKNELLRVGVGLLLLLHFLVELFQLTNVIEAVRGQRLLRRHLCVCLLRRV